MADETSRDSASDANLYPLSERLGGTVIQAYRAGGLGLTFVVLGGVFFLSAVATPQRVLAYTLACAGTALLALPCYFFYVKEVRPLADINRRVRENGPLVDTVQEAAVQMTDVASDLQALAYKYAEEVTQLMSTVRPILRRIPGVGHVADSKRLNQADELAAGIVELTDDAKDVIRAVREALVRSDAAELRKYIAELERVHEILRRILTSTQVGGEQPV